jgi:RNA polymerase sigma-70 factor (ECF subfamily)
MDIACASPAVTSSIPVPIPAPIPGVPTPIADVVSHRAYLLRFALRKLRDPALAEDAVHDVFEAVLSGRASFGGRAALRSWLTAVLKNKIVDALRRMDHHEALDDEASDLGLDLASTGPRPDEVAEQRQELARALAAIERLKPSLREAMRLRVLEDGETGAVCAALGISEENLFVRVHRARKQLLS